MQYKNIRGDFGKEIICESGDSMSDLVPEDLIDMFKTSGVLLFRNFKPDLEQFNSFAARFGADFMSYKGGGYIRRKVNEGVDETLLSVNYDHGREQDTFGLPLHGEMYYVDHRPVSLWFYCKTPAASEGETTICDGSELYNELSDEHKQLLNEKRLKYVRSYADGEWQKIYETEDRDEAVRFAEYNGLSVVVDNENNALNTEYIQPGVITSRWGGHKVYINNILTVQWQEDMGRKTSIVRFEDGEPIPRSLIDEVVAIQQRIIVPIAWKAGDFTYIDNTRTLHGRRAFSDKNRDVYLRMVQSVEY